MEAIFEIREMATVESAGCEAPTLETYRPVREEIRIAAAALGAADIPRKSMVVHSREHTQSVHTHWDEPSDDHHRAQ